MRKLVLTMILLSNVYLTNAQGSTFVFTNTGTTSQMDSALNFTGRIWGKFLNSSIPIKINIIYTNLGPATNLAITIPNGRKDFANAPQDSVWYPSCLANSLANIELNPGEFDMDIYVNSNTNWYLDTLGNPGTGQYDFVTVMLHEIGHGLGFLSLAKYDSNDLGSFGMVTASDILPLVSSFPFPVQEGLPSTFALFMENGNNESLLDTLLYPNNSLALGDEFVSNNLYFDGPQTLNYNGNLPARLYAPATYASGSSLQHLHEGTFPSSNPNSLMTPFINAMEVHHHPGDLTIAMLEDMGWNVNYIQSIDEQSDFHFSVFPNPASEVLIIHPNTDKGTISFSDLQGRIIYSTQFNSISPIQISVFDFDRGAYILQLNAENILATTKLILD